MRPADPAAVRARFRRVVARGIERADREEREHLAKLRPLKKRTAAELREAQTFHYQPRRTKTRRP